MFGTEFEPVSETPCDPFPTAESGRAGRRTRLAATLGVGLVGAASLSTAVYQTISQSSTTLGMPGASVELDTPLPWGTPVAAPVGSVTSSPTITPTVADLDLRSEQQPLAAPQAPGSPAAPPLGVSAPRPAAVGPSDAGPRSSPPARGGGGGGRPSSSTPGASTGGGAPSTSTGSGTSSPTPSSSTPSSSPSSSEPTSEPPSEPTGQPTSEPSTPPPSGGTAPSAGSATSPSGDGAG